MPQARFGKGAEIGGLVAAVGVMVAFGAYYIRPQKPLDVSPVVRRPTSTMQPTLFTPTSGERLTGLPPAYGRPR